MHTFYIPLLALSLSGTLLSLLLVLLKRFYQNRFSRCWQYYIWILAALRFVIPFSTDTALVNVLFQTAETAIIQNSTAVSSFFSRTKDRDAAAIPQTGSTQDAAYLQNDNAQTDNLQTGSQICINTPEADIAFMNTNAAWDFEQLDTQLPRFLFLIWLLPALFLLIRKIRAYQRFVHDLKTNGTAISDPQTGRLLAACKKTWGITRNIALYHAPWLSTPVMTGFFYPCIAIPDLQMSQTELSFIFTHELIHYKRRDLYYKWFIQAVRCIHWFNPFVNLLEKEVNKACELSCDEAVIHALGSRERKAYGNTLLLCARPGRMCDHAIGKSVSSVMLTESAAQLKERLRAIMKYQKKTKKTMFFTTAVTAGLCICFPLLGTYAAPVPTRQSPSTQQTEPVRTAYEKQSKFPKYRELLKLNTKSSRNMTVADFREHAACVLDTREGMRLLEQALRDEQINLQRFTNDDAFFIRNILIPLTDGNWKSDFITAAGVERPLKNGMLAELEFRAGLRIRNASMKISEYEDAYRRLADTALTFLNKKTDSELSDDSANSTSRIEKEAMQKLQKLADIINKTANLTLTIQTCIYAPETGPAVSKITTSKNIPSDVKKVLTLKTDSYKDLTAKEFRDYLSERYEADHELWKARQRCAYLNRKELQKKLSQADYLFLTVTLPCTESESTYPHDRTGSIPPDFGDRFEAIDYPKRGTTLSFEWTVRYEINASKLTIRERDNRIVHIQRKMAEFIENTPKDTDIGTMKYLKKMRHCLDRLIEETSSPDMKMTVFECRSDGKSA